MPVPVVVVVVLPFVLAHQVVLPLDLAEAVLASAANRVGELDDLEDVLLFCGKGGSVC